MISCRYDLNLFAARPMPLKDVALPSLPVRLSLTVGPHDGMVEGAKPLCRVPLPFRHEVALHSTAPLRTLASYVTLQTTRIFGAGLASLSAVGTSLLAGVCTYIGDPEMALATLVVGSYPIGMGLMTLFCGSAGMRDTDLNWAKERDFAIWKSGVEALPEVLDRTRQALPQGALEIADAPEVFRTFSELAPYLDRKRFPEMILFGRPKRCDKNESALLASARGLNDTGNVVPRMLPGAFLIGDVHELWDRANTAIAARLAVWDAAYAATDDRTIRFALLGELGYYSRLATSYERATGKKPEWAGGSSPA